jgi:hypothetical protein
MIESATRRAGDWTLQSIRDGLRDGSLLVWLARNDSELFGIAITQLRPSHSGLQCWVILVAGKRLKLWRHLIERIEQFAKDEGCSVLRWEGRKGWGRIFPESRLAYVAYEKRLK